MSRRTRAGVGLALAAGLAAACVTSPTGRSQLMLVSDAQMAEMGATAFRQMREKLPVARDPSLQAYVRCVTDALAGAVQAPGAPQRWTVEVFAQESANAFALPGGRIGVHTGLLEVTENDAQLATVIGHEMAHVIAQHANERVSTQLAAQGGLDLLQALAGAPSPTKNALLGALGVGAQVGVVLPFSRAQEAEADVLGLEILARAGFDPRAAPRLWERMAAQGGGPPELLSTHPSGASRIRTLQARVPEVMPLYERARAAGRRPRCG